MESLLLQGILVEQRWRELRFDMLVPPRDETSWYSMPPLPDSSENYLETHQSCPIGAHSVVSLEIPLGS